MNVKITTFTNPFSFFCVAKEAHEDNEFNVNTELAHAFTNVNQIAGLSHGQYIAVLWNNKWSRGIVTMENNLLIWLIDCGIYIRPNQNTVFTNLPIEYRKHPTKVFEASIHGIAPVDKILSDTCEIINEICDSWNEGSIEKAKTLINQAYQIYFVPIGLVTTKYNDIVLGDLYLELPKLGFVNIIEELLLWPVFLEKNKEVYIKNLSTYYTSHRKHSASLLKPVIPKIILPTFSLNMTLVEYNSICSSAELLQPLIESGTDTVSVDGSTIVAKDAQNKEAIITSEEIKRYRNEFIEINGQEHNMLDLMINKIKDFNICKRYRNHDLHSVGRATSYYRRRNNIIM